MADTNDTDRPTFTAEDLAMLGNADKNASADTDAADTDLDHDELTDASVVVDDGADTDAGDKGDGGGDQSDAGKTAAAKGGKAAARVSAKGSVLDDEPDADAGDPDADPEADAAAKAATDAADGDKDADDTDAVDDKGKKPDTAWRDEYAKRQIARLEKDLRGKLLAKDFDKEFKKRSDAIKSRLARYKTREDYMDAGWAAQERIQSGELNKAAKLPADATPQEIAAYRKANNIPDKADAYEIPKVAGHEWTDADKPVLDVFKQAFHDLGLPQEAAGKLTTTYAQTMQKAIVAHEQAVNNLDKEGRASLEETLRADPDIGNAEYRPMITLVKRALADPEALPPDLVAALDGARGADGHLLLNKPAVMKHLGTLAVEHYGDTGMPNGDAAARVAGDAKRKAEIERVMGTDDYYRDQAMQDEYQEILVREQTSKSGGGRRGRRAA